MNTQQIQEVLNYLLIAIIAFAAIVIVVDFICGLVHLWHQVTLNIESSLNSSTSEQLHVEFSPLQESLNVDNPQPSTNSIISESSPETDNCVSIDIAKIDLRTARKIASAIKKASQRNPDLIIPQKINGKSVTLAWLQAQIQHRLELAPEMGATILQELAPTALISERLNLDHSSMA
ncbi:hypothetical protein [Anabaena sp. CCY 0017]|uniref:hypothetical protein n=1 Tax=Anabaena sp. CCY 0017 TaxID=3103866 RepID=UPI0039C6AB3A